MRKAYVFPKGVKPTLDNIAKAQPVDVATSCEALMAARDEHRLTCLCKTCLWPLTLVFENAPSRGALDHFAHWPAAEPHPDCPYRAEQEGAPHEGDGGRRQTRPRVSAASGPDLLADVIEHQLRVRYGTQVRRRKPDTLYVTRLRATVRVLTPASAAEIGALKHPPLLVVAEGDVSKLPALFPLPRPLAVVKLDLSHEQDDRFGLLDVLPPSPDWRDWPGCIEPLATLDLTPMAYVKRFRVRRHPEVLWISDSFKPAIACIEGALHARIPASVLKLRRALVKRLLADGAWLHRVFAATDAPEARWRAGVRGAFVVGAFQRERDLLTRDELRNLRASSWRRRLEAGPRLVRTLCQSLFVEADLWEQILALRAALAEIEAREAQEKEQLDKARVVLEHIRADLAQVTGMKTNMPIDADTGVR